MKNIVNDIDLDKWPTAAVVVSSERNFCRTSRAVISRCPKESGSTTLAAILSGCPECRLVKHQ